MTSLRPWSAAHVLGYGQGLSIGSFLKGRNPSAQHQVFLLACILLSSSSSWALAQDGTSDSRLFEGRWFARSGPVGPTEQRALRDEAREMFFFGFDNYLKHGLPKDEVRPISCRGHDSQGGIAITLIDSLDTLLLMGGERQLVEAVRWLEQNISFDLDKRVHVFELTIRALGGLLSTHVLLTRNAAIMPEYSGGLLRLATDLGDRLLPAFETPSGIPLSWVNLRKGVPAGETRVTCTACAGTLLLELGLLSRLTGNPVYEHKALHAARQVYGIRSTATGLVGNTLNADSLNWERLDASIGAGVDSFYEYLLKAYLQFGDEEYLNMFSNLYAAAMRHLRPADAGWAARGWLGEVHLHSGVVMQPWISSLSAFWPGLQALIGQTDDAALLHGNWTAAWKTFGWLPELFDAGVTQRHPLQRGYPLRPELIESTYLLHAATGDGAYLEAGRLFQSTLAEHNRQKCGFASVADVATGALEDTMESFFLSETTKYLYLLNSNATALPDHYIFSTEGHLLPVLASPGDSGDVGGECRLPKTSEGRQGERAIAGGVEGDAEGNEGVGGGRTLIGKRNTSVGGIVSSVPWTEATPTNCAALCAARPAAETAAADAALREAFPLLPLAAPDAALLRRRKCTACRVVTRAMADMRARAAREAACRGENCTTPAAAQVPPRQILCRLQADERGQLICYHLEVVADLPPAKMQSLPPDAVIVQFTQMDAAATSLAVQGGNSPGEEAPEHFLELHVSGQGADGKDFKFSLAGAGASFGPALDSSCEGGMEGGCIVSGDLVLGSPSDGCHSLAESPDTKGSMVVLKRGGCMFALKVANAQAAGANAAIVLSNEEWLMQMGGDDTNHPDIPSVLLPAAAAETLRRTLADATGRLRGSLKALAPDQAAAAMSAPAQPPIDACPAGTGAPVSSAGEPVASASDSSAATEACLQPSEAEEASGVDGDQGSCSWHPVLGEDTDSGFSQGENSEERKGNSHSEGQQRPCLQGDKAGDGSARGDVGSGVGGVGEGEGVEREGLEEERGVKGAEVVGPGEATPPEDQDTVQLLKEGLQKKLGPEQAKSAVQAAMAAASATLQQKRVEVLIPPQAADWLQEKQQSGKQLDVGAAVNGMLLQIAKDNLAASVRDLAAAAAKLAAAAGQGAAGQVASVPEPAEQQVDADA